MRTIFGVDDIVLVDEDGSPCGQKVRRSPPSSFLPSSSY